MNIVHIVFCTMTVCCCQCINMFWKRLSLQTKMVKTRRCSIETSQTSGFSSGAIAWSSEILLYCTLFAITSLEFTSVRFPTQKLTNSMQGH